jgi:general secretion pathway protein H
MPTSAPGSSLPALSAACAPRRKTGGFTLLELLVVLAVIAVGVALVVLTLPDGDAARLDEEGARLTALLESARAESRTSGMPVRWVTRTVGDSLVGAQGEAAHFRFVGLPSSVTLPSRWMDERVSAQVVGATSIVLGPEAILPAQRIVLTLGERRLELATDGLGPFALADPPPAANGPRP